MHCMVQDREENKATIYSDVRHTTTGVKKFVMLKLKEAFKKYLVMPILLIYMLLSPHPLFLKGVMERTPLFLFKHPKKLQTMGQKLLTQL